MLRVNSFPLSSPVRSVPSAPPVLKSLHAQMKSRPLLVLGLMSGTSADAIDVALARVSGTPPDLSPRLLDHTSIHFPTALRKEILRLAEQQPISAGELSQLNFRLGEVFAEAVRAACKRFRVPTKKIALIGILVAPPLRPCRSVSQASSPPGSASPPSPTSAPPTSPWVVRAPPWSPTPTTSSIATRNSAASA
jgi:Anhydro-N-acetylmuramic acid kinase